MGSKSSQSKQDMLDCIFKKIHLKDNFFLQALCAVEAFPFPDYMSDAFPEYTNEMNSRLSQLCDDLV